MSEDLSLTGYYNIYEEAVPQNLRALNTNSGLLLMWDPPKIDPVFIDSYNVYNNTADKYSKQYSFLGNTSGYSYLVQGLNPRETYFFSVTLSKRDGPTELSYSPVYMGYSLLGIDALGNGSPALFISGYSTGYADWSYMPTGVLTTSNSSTSVKVIWGFQTGTLLPIQGYRVWRADTFTSPVYPIGSTTGLEYIDSGLTPMKSYYYRVTNCS